MELSNEKRAPGCLGDLLGMMLLPSYMGIISQNHDKKHVTEIKKTVGGLGVEFFETCFFFLGGVSSLCWG